MAVELSQEPVLKRVFPELVLEYKEFSPEVYRFEDENNCSHYIQPPLLGPNKIDIDYRYSARTARMADER